MELFYYYYYHLAKMYVKLNNLTWYRSNATDLRYIILFHICRLLYLKSVSHQKILENENESFCKFQLKHCESLRDVNHINWIFRHVHWNGSLWWDCVILISRLAVTFKQRSGVCSNWTNTVWDLIPPQSKATRNGL